MNTSDQNVFTLDTAFQRRWNMRLIENNFNNVRRSLSDAEILDTKVTWQKFCDTVNTIIIGNRAKMASAEDKRLGVYFVHEQDLIFDSKALPTGDFMTTFDELNDLVRHELLGTLDATKKARLEEMRDAILHNRLFPEKVIKYLWDDAFKFNPEAIFDTENMDSLEKVIRTFVYNKGADGFKIFNWAIYHMDCGIELRFFSMTFNLIPDFWHHINSEVIGNLLMFIPFGILYSLAKKKPSIKNTVLTGFICTLVIEILQPVFGRAFDINDVILNTVGVVIGTLLYFVGSKVFRKE